MMAVSVLENTISYQPPFFRIAQRLNHSNLLAVFFLCPDFLLNLLAIKADDLIRGFNDRPRRTVILLQLKNLSRGEILLKIQYILNSRSSKGINTLCIISYNTQVFITPLILFQQFQDAVLQRIGILKLIHHDMRKTLAILIPSPIRILIQQAVHLQ